MINLSTKADGHHVKSRQLACTVVAGRPCHREAVQDGIFGDGVSAVRSRCSRLTPGAAAVVSQSGTEC